jgi:hypothetical protein
MLADKGFVEYLFLETGIFLGRPEGISEEGWASTLNKWEKACDASTILQITEVHNKWIKLAETTDTLIDLLLAPPEWILKRR